MKKIVLLVLLGAIVLVFFQFDLGQYLTLDYIKERQQDIDRFYAENRLLTLLGYFVVYVLVTGASLPGAAVLTLAGGAVFGLVTGVVVVSFASTIGASLAFLLSRYLLRDLVQNRFGSSLRSINRGIEKEGPFYLFAMRLVPAFPFFVINLVMGLTRLRLWTFFWVSQVGMLAGTVVYVNAGTQLAQIDSPEEIFSPGILLSFLLLAALPFIGRRVVAVIGARRALADHEPPDKFDTNLVVIGAGSAGLVTAYIAAAVKAKVTLIEKHKMGGDCLNFGCVPSKALIRSAKFMSQIARSREFGIARADAEFDFAEVMERVQQVVRQVEPHDSVERYTGLGVDVVLGEARVTSPWSVEVNGETISARNIVVASGARPFVPPIEGIARADAEFDFAEVMERVQQVVRAIEPHDSVERYTGLGVDVVLGEARVTSPWTVEVNGETISARNIVVASGARPFVPPIEGIDQVDYYTSDNLWDIRRKPQKLAVLGGGPIGSELAQAFARLGAEVTQVEMLPRLLSREDPEISALVEQRFADEGIRVLTGHTAKKFIKRSGKDWLIAEQGGNRVEIEFDTLLVAVGRAPNSRGFGLEELGVRLNDKGNIEVNEYLQSSIPTIYACGDVAGPYQFTHVGAHQAWYTSVNSLFGIVRRFKADYSVIPSATFIEPEIARVGLNESEAQEQGVEYEMTRFGIDDLDRAIADSEAHGFVKVLTVPGKDRILGVTIVGEHAGDLIAEYVLAMRHGLGLNKILGTIHIYPTLAEANKYAAGEWKRAHAPEKLLEWVARFHRWRRGGDFHGAAVRAGGSGDDR